MPEKPPKDIAASARARLRQLAGERGEDFENLLERYAAEGVLRRLASMETSERFVLKGAMLFPLWGLDGHRATRDLDFLGQGDMSPDALQRLFRDVASREIADGLRFDAASILVDPIREAERYGGARVEIRAELARARVRVQIDIGVGDAVDEIARAEFPTLLDQPRPTVLAYSMESAIAEKLHAIATLGMANSRMKDYHDLWALSRNRPFGFVRLSRAVAATFERRQTVLPATEPLGLSDIFAADDGKRAQWRAHRSRQRDGAIREAELFEVVAQLRAFLAPTLAPIQMEEPREANWSPSRGSWVEE